MKILLHSNAPWVPSGYGKQAKHLIKAFHGLGHEVVVSCFSGFNGSPIVHEGVLHLPNGQYDFGVDVLPGHLEHVKPDLTLTLMDTYKLGPILSVLKEHNTACWMPVDCAPLGKLDQEVVKRSEVTPIAMSQFGREQLKGAGFSPEYAPHAFDPTIFKPLSATNRAEYREAMGLKDRFVIGICAANNDTVRKAFPEQLEAFRRFHKRHEEAYLLIHSNGNHARGLRLDMLAYDLGLPMESVRISDTYPQVAGMFDDTLLADWFGVLDVLSLTSYGEGFGVPLIEAQACGTPVVVNNFSAMSELRGPGWTTTHEPFWNHVHGAWWAKPSITSIVRQYEKAHTLAASRRDQAITFAADYTVDAVTETYWKPILERLEVKA